MMFPIYFVVGLINLLAQQKNYGIQNQDPNFDIRVRRDIPDQIQDAFNVPRITENYWTNRQKRHAYYNKIRVNNYASTSDSQANTQNYENQGHNGSSNLNNRYTIFNPNYNFLFNTTRRNNTNNANNFGVKNRTIRPYIRSYPYGYPPGYAPATTAGYNKIPTGYNNDNTNTPYYYNYQNPNGNNFAGFYGFTTPGYNLPVPNNMPRSYTAPWNTQLAPYPSTSPLKHQTNTAYNKFAPTYNTPTPYGQDNSPGNNYKPFNTLTSQNSGINYNIDTSTPNTNIPVTNSTVTNNTVTNSTLTTTEKIVSSCVICNIPCPQFMRRFGRYCIQDDDEE